MIDNALDRSHRVISSASEKLSLITLVLMGLTFVVQCFELYHKWSNWQGTLSATVFAIISLVLLAFYIMQQQKHSFTIFTVFFLTSTFTMIIAWRICVLLDLKYTSSLYLIPFALKIINYILCAANDMRHSKVVVSNMHHRSAYEWQLMTIRIFIGFDFIPHFSEKLFAGPIYRHADVVAFQQLHVPHALLFVWIAGLIEFGACFSIGCGFLTRLGAICSCIYIFVAAYLGNHFALGFIWASPGGGWEFPVFWSLLLLSFALFGGDAFALDYALYRRYSMPEWLRHLMGVRCE